MRIRSKGGAIHQLKVTLRHIRPPIWRRFLVPSDTPLKRLHDALQAVMGWQDCHLHNFEAGGVVYATRDPDFPTACVSEARTLLAQVLRKPKDRLVYTYDFGDGWAHDVVLEKVLPDMPDGQFPAVLAGKRACPPEDVGGVWGYAHFLEAIGDPKHPEHAELLEWAGDSFDPEAFSVRDANLAIHGGWVFEGEE